jgi:hypothetical protein
VAKNRHRKTFDRLLRVGVPSALAEAVASAASQRLESLNGYTRRALLTQLQKDGFALPPRGEKGVAA